MLNFDLIRININYFFILNDLSFSAIISLSEEGVLVFSRNLHVYLKWVLLLSHILHVYLKI